VDFWDLPKDQALEAFSKTSNPSLTDKLLYAILAQLDKLNHQLDLLNQKGGS
jgi:hypothetical protein